MGQGNESGSPHLGHILKMASMPIYDKTFKKTLGLVCSIGDMSPIKFEKKKTTLGLTLTFLRKGQFVLNRRLRQKCKHLLI